MVGTRSTESLVCFLMSGTRWNVSLPPEALVVPRLAVPTQERNLGKAVVKYSCPRLGGWIHLPMADETGQATRDHSHAANHGLSLRRQRFLVWLGVAVCLTLAVVVGLLYLMN